MFQMNFLAWNCRGAGGANLPSLIKDCMRLYHLDFIAIMEPKVSGLVDDKVIQRIGLNNCVRVEAQGFSGGIGVFGTPDAPINVVSTSRYFIHLHHPLGTFLLFMLALI